MDKDGVRFIKISTSSQRTLSRLLRLSNRRFLRLSKDRFRDYQETVPEVLEGPSLISPIQYGISQRNLPTLPI